MERRPFQFLRGKVGLAVIGACLIGGTSAVLAARTVHEMSASLAYSSNNVSNNSQNTATTGSQSPTDAATSTTEATATTHSGGGGGGGANPTATPITVPTPRPTQTPRPTPTPFIVGQSCSVSGSIQSKGSSSFGVHHNGQNYTIDVNGSTTFTGAATTFALLTVGMDASVNGTTQPDLSCLASTVDTSAGGN
jgi:hypothetical protein